MTNTPSQTCNEAVNKLADWIGRALKGESSRRQAFMTDSFEARNKAAVDLVGRYYGTMPEFTELCDQLAGDEHVRLSAVRDALRCLHDRKTASATPGRRTQSTMRTLASSGVAA